MRTVTTIGICLLVIGIIATAGLTGVLDMIYTGWTTITNL